MIESFRNSDLQAVLRIARAVGGERGQTAVRRCFIAVKWRLPWNRRIARRATPGSSPWRARLNLRILDQNCSERAASTTIKHEERKL